MVNAKPVELDKEFSLEIKPYLRTRCFIIIAENGDRGAMSGPTNGIALLNREFTAALQFTVILPKPRACVTLEIENLQSIYFDKMLGPRIMEAYPMWLVKAKVSYISADDQFVLHLPCGLLKAKNIT